jgi:hypothetical protein
VLINCMQWAGCYETELEKPAMNTDNSLLSCPELFSQCWRHLLCSMSGRRRAANSILTKRSVPQVAGDCGVLSRSETAGPSERSLSYNSVWRGTCSIQDKLNQSILITFRPMMQMSLTRFVVWPVLQLRYRETLMKFKPQNFLCANFKRGKNRQIT